MSDEPLSIPDAAVLRALEFLRACGDLPSGDKS
jgi:hypothetical protein